MVACSFCNQNNADMIFDSLLGVQGIDIMKQGPNNQTALHYASSAGNSKALKKIIAYAEENLDDTEDFFNGQTTGLEDSLMFAVKSNDVLAVGELLNAGCNVFQRNGFGQSALDIARSQGNQEMENAINDAITQWSD